MFINIFVPMNKVKLLVQGREVPMEQQQVVQARVIWYVPCIFTHTCSFVLHKGPVCDYISQVSLRKAGHQQETVCKLGQS